MIKRITITDDLIKVLPLLYIQAEGDDVVYINRKWLLGGTHLLEDMSFALGIRDRGIAGTEDDAEGVAFNEDDTKMMMDLYQYISDNLFYIESLIHQFSVKGGLTKGTYKCIDNELIWEKESD